MIDFRQFTSFTLGPSLRVEAEVLVDPIGVDWLAFVGCTTGESMILKCVEMDPETGEPDNAPALAVVLEMIPQLEELSKFINNERGAIVTYRRVTPPIDLERFSR